MDNAYYETVDHLEKLGVNKDYIQGWVGGYLGNPEREEQRVTDAYKACLLYTSPSPRDRG